MTGLAAAAALDRLGPLDRRWLHVFVAGPGYGEGIAVALPGRGWLVVDGCQVLDGDLPLLEILERWRGVDDPVDSVILTHPHQDHAYGVRRVLERAVPLTVGIAAPPEAPHLGFHLDQRASTQPAASDQLRRGTVQDAFAAIQRWMEQHPDGLLCLVDEAPVPVSSSRARVHARSPLGAHARAALERARASRHLSSPNELSVVLEIEFEETRVVLGSDLEASSSGWPATLDRRPELAKHLGLKIPHHGSPGAFHPRLCEPGEGRAWWVTPFNRSQLPPLRAEGIPRLVALNRRVLLTATPRPRDLQPAIASPAEIPIADLPTYFQPAAPAGLDARSITPPPMAPLDPVWCVAFDGAGQVQGAWRGRRALAAVP